MKLIPDLREFLDLLTSESVQFLVIGGWAYNSYAEPRFTGDLDIFLCDDPDTEKKVRIVLEKFGMGDSLPPKSRKLFQKKILMIGRPPNRIDLICQIDGLSFEEAWKNRVLGKLDDLSVSFISVQDLIKNKSATGRDKDNLDVENLKRITARKKSNTAQKS